MGPPLMENHGEEKGMRTSKVNKNTQWVKNSPGVNLGKKKTKRIKKTPVKPKDV
jgi:hypothetical protein